MCITSVTLFESYADEGCYGEEVLSEDDEINEEVQRSSVVSSRKKAKKA